MAYKDINKRREYQREWYKKNTDKRRENSRKWHKNNPEKAKAYKLKQRYGLSLKDKEAMFARQGFRCAVCETKTARQWDTDHCHKSSEIRGILCPQCNKMLGIARDKASVLRRAAQYIEHNWLFS